MPDLTLCHGHLPVAARPNTVFVTFNDFQRGNFQPYLLKSADLGKTGPRSPATSPAAVRPGPLSRITSIPICYSSERVRIVVYAGCRPPLAAHSGRHARHSHPRPRDSAARERSRRGVLRTRLFVIDDYAPLRQLTAAALSAEGALFAAGRTARCMKSWVTIARWETTLPRRTRQPARW